MKFGEREDYGAEKSWLNFGSFVLELGLMHLLLAGNGSLTWRGGGVHSGERLQVLSVPMMTTIILLMTITILSC